MKVIYIGAGLDVKPIQFLSNIKDFVYIDCQPFSEFGTKIHKCTPGWCSKNCLGFSRPMFLPRLKTSMEKIGMKYKKISDDELEFTNDKQLVTYFINTSMPEHIDKVKSRIKGFDNFIVMGHDPDSTVLKYTNNKITFWGNEYTYYRRDDLCDEINKTQNNIISRLHREIKTRNKFNWFNIIKGNKVYRFDRWSNFVYNSM